MKNFVIKIFYFLFSFSPIKRNQLLFIDYYGAKYGDSPACLSEYLVKYHPEWKILWAFNEPIKFNINGVRKIKYFSLHFFFILATSKVLITNYRMPEFFKKRKGQKYLQTWHSSLRLKKIEKDAKEKLSQQYIKMAQLDSKKIDLILSGARMSSETFRNSFWYDGEILECGTPRIDKLINVTPDRIKKLKKFLDIGPDDKIVLYCPTFRQHEEDKKFYLDPAFFLKVLNEKCPYVNWKLLVRYHPHESMRSHYIQETTNIKDVSTYPDAQDILSIADLMVTDYSSVMFDFAYTTKPCFLFVPDLDQYIANERELYFNINSLPFPISYNSSELIDKIINLDLKKYGDKIESFLENIGSFEKGNACEGIIEKLEEWIK